MANLLEFSCGNVRFFKQLMIERFMPSLSSSISCILVDEGLEMQIRFFGSLPRNGSYYPIFL